MAFNSFLFVSVFAFISCTSPNETKHKTSRPIVVQDSSEITKYRQQHTSDSIPSTSTGSVSNGQLKHGKLVPFDGDNFRYFDTTSYLNDRAFVHDKVLKTVLETYRVLASSPPGRTFTIMECSHKNGGKLYPHRTHQNGLSIDFMMPLVKDGKPYYKLDTIGQFHYLLDFDNTGRLTQDTSIHIDFELVANHIVTLDSVGSTNGLSIKKVIVNTDLKDELYAGSWGTRLKTSSVYVVRSLTPLINSLHDDHYHIDFEIID